MVKTKTVTRWLPHRTHSVFLKNGVKWRPTANHVHSDGIRGYPELPKGMNKDQKASFYSFTIEIPDDRPVVEQATAAPGETRTVKKPAAKKTTAKKTTAKK